VVISPLKADFTYVPASPIANQPVTFTDASTGSPTSWAWDFDNDGTVDSTARIPPTVIFSNAGTYTVTLKVSKGDESSTIPKDIIVAAPPVPLTADFTATQAGCTSPWTVTFTDKSTGSPTSWKWEYKKASESDSLYKAFTYPSLTPLTSGTTYNIRLTVTKGTESSIAIKSITPGKLTASFTPTSASGKYPLTVKFTDTSIGIPTSWKWEYKLATSSTYISPPFSYDQNPPSFTFPVTPGTYNVRLTVSKICGSTTSSICQPATITVKAPTYTIVYFTTVGSTTWTVPSGVTSVEYLVIAGGGSGGSQPATYFGAGGGGAGGLRTGTGFAVSGIIPVTVGAGGAAPSAGNYQGNNGGDSAFSTITATGGGGGGSGKNDALGAGKTGGSGGGEGWFNSPAGYGSGTSGQGNKGGSGVSSGSKGGGGGGGAGADGGDAGKYGGKGGAGTASSITGTATTYACGGGGGVYEYAGTAGAGGCTSAGAGGAKSTSGNNGNSGTKGTGSGGGGATSGQSAAKAGGAGGSGIVIIKYQNP